MLLAIRPKMLVGLLSAFVWSVVVPDLRSRSCAAGGGWTGAKSVNLLLTFLAWRSPSKLFWVERSGVSLVSDGAWISVETEVSSFRSVGSQKVPSNVGR